MAELNPDEVLKKALGLAQSMTEVRAPFEVDGDGVRLAELVLALDRWLSGGGRTPSRWVENSAPAVTNGTVRSPDAG